MLYCRQRGQRDGELSHFSVNLTHVNSVSGSFRSCTLLTPYNVGHVFLKGILPCSLPSTQSAQQGGTGPGWAQSAWASAPLFWKAQRSDQTPQGFPWTCALCAIAVPDRIPTLCSQREGNVSLVRVDRKINRVVSLKGKHVPACLSQPSPPRY